MSLHYPSNALVIRAFWLELWFIKNSIKLLWCPFAEGTESSGLVIKALNGTTYLKDRNIRGNKIITSAQEEGTRPELELVGINVAGEAGAAGGHSTLGT